MVVKTTIGEKSFDSRNEVEECGLWLGISSMNSNRLSVYAGRDYQEGEGILSFQPQSNNDNGSFNSRNNIIGDLGIPLIDIDYENRFRKNEFNSEMDDFLNACWNGELTGMDLIEGEHEVYTAIPGLGMLLNSHKSITNVDWDYSSLFSSYFFEHQNNKKEMISTGATMATSNNVGAMTHYHNFQIQTKHFVPAGMELFIKLHKGDNEDNNDKHEDSSNDHDNRSVHPSAYYQAMDQAMNHILAYFQNRNYSREKEQEIYKFLIERIIPVVTDGIEDDDSYDLDKYTEQISTLFPKNVGKLQAVQKSGGSLINHFPKMLKSQMYLKKNAQCMDLIYADTSTIPDAGYGAFAKSFIAKENLIAPMPVMRILDKQYLNLHNNNDNHTIDEVRQQLLLNYCYGHPQSSMLLFPYGSFTNYINNAPKLNQVNAKLVWTTASYSHHETLNKLTIPEMKTNQYINNHPIGFDIIATKDIMPGEEIFLDYGLQWRKAWKSHNLNYTKVMIDEENKKRTDFHSISVQELNRLVNHEQFNQPFWTKEELEQFEFKAEFPSEDIHLSSPSLPDYVQHVCFILLTDYNTNHDPRKDEYNKWQQKGFSVSEMDPDTHFDYDRIIRGDNMYPCTLLERSRKDDRYYYTVQLTHEDDDEDNNNMIIVNLPHHLIKYAHKPYTSEIHRNGAFRHAIGIPHQLFPEVWKDLK